MNHTCHQLEGAKICQAQKCLGVTNIRKIHQKQENPPEKVSSTPTARKEMQILHQTTLYLYNGDGITYPGNRCSMQMIAHILENKVYSVVVHIYPNTNIGSLTKDKRCFAVAIGDALLIICPPLLVEPAEVEIGGRPTSAISARVTQSYHHWRHQMTSVAAGRPSLDTRRLPGGPGFFHGVKTNQHDWQPTRPCWQGQKQHKQRCTCQHWPRHHVQ
jgi:hypothetical protein